MKPFGPITLMLHYKLNCRLRNWVYSHIHAIYMLSYLLSCPTCCSFEVEKLTFHLKSTNSSCQLHIIRNIFSREPRACLSPRLRKEWQCREVHTPSIPQSLLSITVLQGNYNKGSNETRRHHLLLWQTRTKRGVFPVTL